MIKNLLPYIFLFAILAGCKSTEEVAAQGDPDFPDETVSNEDDFRFQDVFFDAQKEKSLGNLNNAKELFRKCLESRKEPVVYYELARIEKEQENLNQALKYAKEAHRKQPENFWYANLLAGIHQDLAQYEQAEELYQSLLEKDPSHLETYFDLATTQLHKEDVDAAIETYDRLEDQVGVSEELSLQKRQLYMSIGETDEAIEEMERLSENFPRQIRYMGMLQEIYLEAGEKEEADAMLKKMEKLNPENGILQMKLSQYYAEQGEDLKSYQAMKKAFSSHDIDIDQKVGILLKFFSLSDFDPSAMTRALELLEIIEQLHPDEPKTFAIYGDFLAKNGDLQEAREKYLNALELDPSRKAIWSQVLAVDSELQDFESLVEHSEEAMTLFPSAPEFYLSNGIGHINLDQYDEAISSLETGVAFVIGDSQLKARFYSMIAETHYNKKDYNKSDAAFEKSLEHDPDNVFTLNNYSYYLSLRNENLKRAAEMSKKTNELQPGQPSFQDTYAWILFKQGNLEKAQEWLEKAIRNGGSESPEILEHYGDVLFKLGKEEAAIEHWKMAREAGKGSDLLEQKIRDGKLYE